MSHSEEGAQLNSSEEIVAESEQEQQQQEEEEQPPEQDNGGVPSSSHKNEPILSIRPYTNDDPDYREVSQSPFPSIPPPNFGPDPINYLKQLSQHQNYPHQIANRQHLFNHRAQQVFQKSPAGDRDDDNEEAIIDRSAFAGFSTHPSSSSSNSQPIQETFPHSQEFEWLENDGSFDFNIDWTKGMSFAQRGQLIHDSLYCDSNVIEDLKENKERLRLLPEKVFLDARFKANPYEKIGRAIFQNRSALKMANLDVMFDLTQTADGEVLTFADICAGPGGFTEYILWRKVGGGKIAGKEGGTLGWGITLIGIDDWKLDKFNDDAPTENFTISYGEDSTGNILNPKNILNFSDVISRATQDTGVALVLADGGVSVEVEEVNQEIKTKQLILCQTLTAFSILKVGGCFVCKIFDCFTPFTAGLLYILYRYFEKITIIKPFTSRPANSERYVICKNFHTRKPESVINYLFDVNESLNNFADTEEDVATIVDASLFSADFIDYIKKTNNEIVTKQIESLQRILIYADDPQHPLIDQDDVKQRCLSFWSVPESRSIGKNLMKPIGRSAFPQATHSILGKYKNPTRETFGDMPPLRPKEEVLEEQKNKHRGNSVYDSSWSKPSRERERERERERQPTTTTTTNITSSISNGIDLLSTYLKQPPSRVTLAPENITPSSASITRNNNKVDYKELLRRERKSVTNTNNTNTPLTPTQNPIQKTIQKTSPEIVGAKKTGTEKEPQSKIHTPAKPQPPPINQLQPPSSDLSRKNPPKRSKVNANKSEGETEGEFQISAATLAAIEKYKKK